MVMFPAVERKEGVEAVPGVPGWRGYVVAAAFRKVSMVL